MEKTKEIKVTKIQRYGDIIELLEGNTPTHGTTIEDAITFIEHEVELIENKNKSGSRGKSEEENARDNMERDLILAFLAEQNEAVSITTILTGIPELRDQYYSNQKISYLMRPCLADGRIERVKKGGAVKFKLA